MICTIEQKKIPHLREAALAAAVREPSIESVILHANFVPRDV